MRLRDIRHILGLSEPTKSYLLKASDDDLTEIDDIASVVEGGSDKTGLPTTTEVPTSGGIPARGGAASAVQARVGGMSPQTGQTAEYAEFSARMGDMAKALAEVVAALKPATTTVATPAAKPEVAKSEIDVGLRRARIAVRKAEDDEKDDDEEDTVEKAEKALATVARLVSKAEDDAEDEDAEMETAKSRTALRDLRTKLASIRKSRTPVVVTASPAPAALPKTEVAKSEVETLTLQVNELMSVLAGKGLSTTAIKAPPHFAKSADADPAFFLMKAEKALESGLITSDERLKVTNINSRIHAARRGALSFEAVSKEIEAAPRAVQEIFQQVAA